VTTALCGRSCTPLDGKAQPFEKKIAVLPAATLGNHHQPRGPRRRVPGTGVGFRGEVGLELLFTGIYLPGGACMLVYEIKQD